MDLHVIEPDKKSEPQESTEDRIPLQDGSDLDETSDSSGSRREDAEDLFSEKSELEISANEETKVLQSSGEPGSSGVSSSLGREQELKFTGFEQSKEQGFWAYVKYHKIWFALGAFLGVVAIIVSALLLVSNSSNEKLVIDMPQNDAIEEVSTNDGEVDEESLVIDTARGAYSLKPEGAFFELVADGEAWLTRSEGAWLDAAHWNGWLFYVSNKSPAGVTQNDAGYVLGLEAFNYETQQYLALGDILPPAGATLREPMYVTGDFLYISLNGPGGIGVTYKCQLNEQKSCSDLKLFYSGGGLLTRFTDTQYIVQNLIQNGANATTEISLFDTSDGSVKAITNLRHNGLDGSDLVAIAEDSLLWIVETSSDPNDTSGTASAKLSQMYAVDFAGDKKFELPAQAFPITNPRLLSIDDGLTKNITFVNDAEQVVFDTETKQFGSPKQRVAVEEVFVGEKTEIRTIVELSTRLKIPDGYTLRLVKD